MICIAVNIRLSFSFYHCDSTNRYQLRALVPLGAAATVNVIYGSLGISINAGGLSVTVPLSGFGRADHI